MKNDLKNLLFKKIVRRADGSSKALFRFQSQLAKAIEEEENEYNNAESLRPYLNQTLKYDGYSGKPMSSELKEAIIIVCKKRMDSTSNSFKEFEKDFEIAYQSMIEKKGVKNFESDEEEFDILRNWQNQSNRTVIFNREPLEVKYIDPTYDGDFDGKGAGDLLDSAINNLLKNFKINNKAGNVLHEVCKKLSSGDKLELSSKDRNEQYFFRYYVGSYNTAKKLWQGLIKFLMEGMDELGLSSSKEKFELSIKVLELFNGNREHLNIEDNVEFDENGYDTTFLGVYKTEKFLLTLPLAYYECSKGIMDKRNNVRNFEMLFSFILNVKGQKSVSMVGGEDLDFWKEQIYYPMYWADGKKFTVENITLTKVLSHIKRTTKKEFND